MAVKNKRYYWIQLTQDFFKSKEMKLLRKIAGGDTHTIIYLKMMLISLEDGGCIYYDGLADNLAEEIALMIDENVEDIKITLLFLESKGLLTRKSDRDYFLEQVPEMVGSETASARRVRKFRENKLALQCNDDVTKRNGEIEKDINIDKDINIELEVRVEKENETLTTAEISKLYQSRIGVLDGQQYQILVDYVREDKMEPDLIKRAIGKAADNSKRSFGYINRILKNWAQNGIRTVAQQDEEQRRYLEKIGIYNPDSNIPEWSKEHPNYQAPEEPTILSREEFLAQDD